MAEADRTTGRSAPLPPQPSPSTPVAVGLVRCSTDDQEHSISDQRIEIETWARESGHDLLEVFEDEGVSGCELDRPGVRQLLSFLEQTQERGTLVVWKRNRLARPDDPRDGLLLERRIERAGWSIRYLHGSQASGNKLVDTLMGVIEHHQSGEFLRSLASDVLRGQLRRATEGGLLVGVAPYGYAREVTSPSGTVRVVGRRESYRRAPGETVRWVPGVPAEIQVVQRIFEAFAGGSTSTRGLAGELNSEGIPSPRGQRWTAKTISKLLKNPVYAGDAVWNRRTTARFVRLAGGKAEPRLPGAKRFGKTPQGDHVVVPDRHEPLVPRRLLQEAGEVFRQRAVHSGGQRHVQRRHPLTGILFCAQCGSPMTASRFDSRGTVYCCSGYRNAKICKCFMILAEVVERELLRTLKEIYEPALELLKPELQEEIRTVLTADMGSSSPHATSLEKLRRRHASLGLKIEQALENMGVVRPDVASRIGTKVEGWTAQRDQLDAEIQAAEAVATRSVDLDQAVDQVMGVFQELEGTATDAPREVRRQLFHRTIARVELRFEVDPAKAHRKVGRHRCVGGPVTITPLMEEAERLLGGNYPVREAS